MGIGERALQGVRFGLQALTEGGRIGREYVEAAGVVLRQRRLALDYMEGCTLLRAGLGEQERSAWEVERRESDFRRRFRALGPPLESARDHQVEDEKDVAFHLPHDAFPDAAQPDDFASHRGGERWLHRAQQ